MAGLSEGDVELIRRMVNDVRDELSRRLEPLEALLGLAEPWQTAAGSLESFESRLRALEALPLTVVDTVPTSDVVMTGEEIVADAVEAVEEIVADAVETVEEIVADAVEVVAEAVEETPPDPPLDDNPPVPGDSDAVVDEILGEHPDAAPTPQRGGFWHGEILRRRS